MAGSRWRKLAGSASCTVLWLLGAAHEIPDRALEVIVFARYVYLAAFLGLLVNALVALWIGFPDLFWPVSLSAQLVGLAYAIAGIVSLLGSFSAVWLLNKVRALKGVANVRSDYMRDVAPLVQSTFARPLKLVACAALAGIYIDLTIVFYSFHYSPVKVVLFTGLLLFSICVARITVPVIWSDLSKSLKITGISLAALGAIAQFWYQSFYVPTSVPAAINYDVSVGPVIQSGRDRLVQVHLAMKDSGSIPEIALESIAIVRGENYKKEEYGPILKLSQPAEDGSFLFPNATFSDDFFVRITDSRVKILQVLLKVYFTRATWLTLGEPRGVDDSGSLTCPEHVRHEWYINESHLRSFTQGIQVLYSDWNCNGWKDQDPDIDSGIRGVDHGRLVDIWFPGPINSDLGIIRDVRYEDFLLPRPK
jgi:hypothetical protein